MTRTSRAGLAARRILLGHAWPRRAGKKTRRVRASSPLDRNAAAPIIAPLS